MIRSKKGGILVYMLGMIALLSVVVTEFLLETATEIRYRSQVTHRNDLEILARSALETTLAVLAEVKSIDKGLYSPDQDWGKPLEYAKFPIPEGYSVSVKMRDETGKLSIYEEDLKVFGALISEMGISYEQGSNLKSDLKAWLAKPAELVKDMKLKPGEKPEVKSAVGTPEAPKPTEGQSDQAPALDKEETNKKEKDKKKQRVVYNLLQLKEIPSFEKVFFDSKKNPNEKFKVLKDSISILHNGPLNINTAPATIRKLLIGDLKQGPSNSEVTYYRSMKELGIQGDASKEFGKQIGFTVNVLVIDILVTRATVKYYLSAIVGIDNESSKTKSKGPGVPIGESPKDSKNKGDFQFLALTEDDNFGK